MLRVRWGALDIADKERPFRIDVDDDKPAAILFDGNGELLTGEALRWCARYGISLILSDGPGAVMTFTHSALEAESASRLADTSPAVIRAQCSANAVAIARELVAAKIEAEAEATIEHARERLTMIGEWRAKIVACRTIGELLIVEAKAAADYWRTFAASGLREAKGGNLPRTWLRFANRQKGAGFLGSKNASHPISAMLNYAYTVEAGRLAKALTARGMTLQIGYLHSDKKGRNSLVWDAIEPLRPIIDAKVFAYIASREFKRSDFVATGASTYRLQRDVISDLLSKAILPQQRINDAADTMLQLVERHADGEYKLYRADMRRRAKKVVALAI